MIEPAFWLALFGAVGFFPSGFILHRLFGRASRPERNIPNRHRGQKKNFFRLREKCKKCQSFISIVRLSRIFLKRFARFIRAYVQKAAKYKSWQKTPGKAGDINKKEITTFISYIFSWGSVSRDKRFVPPLFNALQRKAVTPSLAALRPVDLIITWFTFTVKTERKDNIF